MDVHVWNHNEVGETTMPLILCKFQSVVFLKVTVAHIDYVNLTVNPNMHGVKFMILIEL